MDAWYRFLTVAMLATSLVLIVGNKASQQTFIVQMVLAIFFAAVILLMLA